MSREEQEHSPAGTYVSSIPATAQEQVLATYEDGRKQHAQYMLDDEIVGVRFFFEPGDVEREWALKGGVRHGMASQWDEPGILHFTEPYVNGLVHGIAIQWADDGTVIGSSTMDHGTGIDFWWQGGLHEARYLRNGLRHGFEWWINPDQVTVYVEYHFWEGISHGIERAWNAQGRLRRGYPKYYVLGQQVTKAKYLRASRRDARLPPFRVADNQPARTFPAEVQAQLRSDPAHERRPRS